MSKINPLTSEQTFKPLGRLDDRQSEKRIDQLTSVIFQTGACVAACLIGSFVFPPAAPALLSGAIAGSVILLVELVALSILLMAPEAPSTAKPEKKFSSPEIAFKAVATSEEEAALLADPDLDVCDEFTDDMAPPTKTDTELNLETENGITSRITGEGGINVANMSDWVRAHSAKHPQLLIEFQHQLYGGFFQGGEKQPNNTKPDLTIVPVGLPGVGIPGYILSRLRRMPQYKEGHFAVFIIDHKRGSIEYFDPKGTSIHDELTDSYTGKSVRNSKAEEGLYYELQKEQSVYSFHQYGEKSEELQVQHFTDTVTCGVQCIRRIDQYMQNRGPSPVPPLAVLTGAFASRSPEYLALTTGYAEEVNAQFRKDNAPQENPDSNL